MMLFFSLFVLTLAAVSPSDGQELKLQRGGCPMFWYSYNGRCYKYVATQMTWADAELYCLSQGSNLVSIHSLGEHNFVKSLIMNFDPYQRHTWIGLTDVHKEGRWMWSDGSKYSFSQWSDREPNNLKGVEHCGETNFGNTLRWNDQLCSDMIPFVCASRMSCPE
ncbi:lactose-binding lectin l-2-like [Kryptolebias marmoratus]|uniref:Lactose-binding lectin l-2-like n=1 Tax=Kryptolebias marmoratus TaxID=37003 RepID=A0A3Q2ZHL4_KRYMA|nr:lactose-binding lectin l-2-like [Kryptolebias marmoratus]